MAKSCKGKQNVDDFVVCRSYAADWIYSAQKKGENWYSLLFNNMIVLT